MDDKYFLQLAIEEARKSRDNDGYHVGAVLVKDGKVISRAYSDETNDNGHAEELALKKASENVFGATMYVTMEPCSTRPSTRFSCTDLIISSGIKRIVYGTRDPDIKCQGIERLIYQGIQVTHLKPLEEVCRKITPSLF